MSVAHELPELTVEEALRETAEIVAREGLTPTAAARRLLETRALMIEALYDLAARGLGLALGSEISSQMRGGVGRLSEIESHTGDLSAIFRNRYRRARPSWRSLRHLLAPYQAADGSMKALVEFTADDVRNLRATLKNRARGYLRLDKTLGQILTEIGGGTIGDLPPLRLRQLDEQVGEAFS